VCLSFCLSLCVCLWVSMYRRVANHMGHPTGTLVNFTGFVPFNEIWHYHNYCVIHDWLNQTEVGDSLYSAMPILIMFILHFGTCLRIFILLDLAACLVTVVYKRHPVQLFGHQGMHTTSSAVAWSPRYAYDILCSCLVIKVCIRHPVQLLGHWSIQAASGWLVGHP